MVIREYRVTVHFLFVLFYIHADDGKIVLTDNHAIKVEESSDYIVYSWYMTIHVYDVEPDGVIEYNPKGEPVVLQEALPVGKELKWKLDHGMNENDISYMSDDQRTSGILQNDIFRVPLYKAAEDYNMGSCADITFIPNGALNKEDVFYYKIVVFAEDNPGGDNRHVKGTRASLTGDYNNWILWGGIFLLSGCALVTIFLLWSRKNTKHHKRKMYSKKRKKGKGRARRRA